MKSDKSLSTRLKVSQRDGSTTTSPIGGSLLGLEYIIALPFLGLFSTILLVGYCVKQRIVAVGRWAVQAIVRA